MGAAALTSPSRRVTGHPSDEQLRDYREVVRYGWTNGPGAVARNLRDEIRPDAHSDALAQIDANLLGDAVGCSPGEFENALLVDDPDQPFENWWWHLGALRAGTFPLDQLPDYLVPVYHEAVAERKLDEGE